MTEAHPGKAHLADSYAQSTAQLADAGGGVTRRERTREAGSWKAEAAYAQV